MVPHYDIPPCLRKAFTNAIVSDFVYIASDDSL